MMLAYGVGADYVDEYVRIGENTTIESLKKFVKAVVSIFSDKYLRSPYEMDVARLLKECEKRGFPGMLGSIDCMHWKWKIAQLLGKSNKQKTFAAAQESTRKDVEQAFGVLQARFSIVRGPARFWHRETLKYIMKACIILHTMIVEDERHVENLDFNYDAFDVIPSISVSHDHTLELMDFVKNHCRNRDRNIHSQLQQDLIENIWNIHGSDM